MPTALQNALWPHQRDAIKMAAGYVEAFWAGRTKRSALVHLPTGTGKSGIIAMLARALAGVNGVLVLTPRIALRDQIANDIRGRFFQRLFPPFDPAKLLKAVVCLDGEPTTAEKADSAATVFVSTIQLFYGWSQRQTAFHKLLQRNIDLVLVDEGHYEPAPNWQQAIRGLKCPKVLFTATPYRNDLKVFDVDFAHTFGLSHAEAVDDRFLRRLHVVDRPGHENDPRAFVRDVLDFYDRTFPTAAGQKPDERPRVIIRCDAHDQIRQIAAALLAQGRTVVAVHERFRPSAAHPYERRRVPGPQTEAADFWVHQFKLLEGLDDERFRVVAAFSEFGNARALVQQVGRSLRNRHRTPDQTAYLLDHARGRLGRLWAGYLEYDAYLKERGAKAVLRPGQEMFDALLAGLRLTVYLDGGFRSMLQLKHFNPAVGLQLPRTVNVYRKSASFNLAEMRMILREVCVEEDLVHEVWPFDADAVVNANATAPVGIADANTLVAVYVVQENSPLLRDDFYMDSTLAAVVVRQTAEYVFVLDTAGRVQGRLWNVGEMLGPRLLRKLFRQSSSGRITHVTVRNSNLANDAIRTRALSARAILDTPPYPDDRNSVCSTLAGYAPIGRGSEVVRRYLGFGRGRVSDYGGGLVPLADYLGWLDELRSELQSRSPVRRELGRYALDVQPPADPKPTHVLLDLSEALDQYVCMNHPLAVADQELRAEDGCAAVTLSADGESIFPLVANGATFDVKIRYLPQRGRYELACADLDSAYRSIGSTYSGGLVRHLNDLQAFRVLPRTPGYFYTMGQFYHPEAAFGPGYNDERLGVLKILHPVAKLAEIGSEKGDKDTKFAKPTWPSDTLFGLIDAGGAKTELAAHFGKPDLLVCDDMSTEAADFLIADTARRRVVFIHAKASADEKECSASAMTEVCGQATKNTKFLSKFNDQDAPSKSPRWGRDPWRNGVNKLKRLRRGKGTGGDVWRQFRGLIRDPLSDVEVWIVVGRSLSKARFEALLKMPTPSQEAVQLAYLLQSTITSVTAVGGKLRVFCSP